MKKILFLLSISFLLFFEPPIIQAQQKQVVSNTFTNPLRRGADPFVIKHEGKYYKIWSNANGFTVTESRFLTKFEKEEAVWTLPANASNRIVHRTPQIHPTNRKWYIYYAPYVQKGSLYILQCAWVLYAETPFPPSED